jgi:hypothetical protein
MGDASSKLQTGTVIQEIVEIDLASMIRAQTCHEKNEQIRKANKELQMRSVLVSYQS